MSSLVLHHIHVHRTRERVLRPLAQDAEGSQGQPFDQDLHPEQGEVPAGVDDDVVEQGLQAGVDRVDEVELLVEVPAVDLDVTGLVDHLRGGVELRVDVRHGLHDLGRAHERTLLAVHELAEAPGLQVAADLRLFRRAHPLPPRAVRHGHGRLRFPSRVGRVDGDRPVDAIRRDPLLAACPCRRGAAAARGRLRSRSRRQWSRSSGCSMRTCTGIRPPAPIG